MKKRNTILFSVICIGLITIQSVAQHQSNDYQQFYQGFSGTISENTIYNKSAKMDCDTNVHLGVRTLNGMCNNLANTDFGKAGIKLLRLLPPQYGSSNVRNAVGGEFRPNPRHISNALIKKPTGITQTSNLSSFTFTWGQFLDHDITITPESEDEFENIEASEDQNDLITNPIRFQRSNAFEQTGETSYREQENQLSAWIDGSNVYGISEDRANWLRTKKDGKLKTSKGNLLPFNTITGEIEAEVDTLAPAMNGGTNRSGETIRIFVAGDRRANEQPGLTCLHTLFVREHNRICEEIVAEGETDDETIYQLARKQVGGLIASITYNEFLPALGINMNPYGGYNNAVQPDISNVFATAAFRIGHTMVTDKLLLLDDNGNNIHGGSISLKEAFRNFNLIEEIGIEPFLSGLQNQLQEKIDIHVVEDLRTFLFAPLGGVGLDLAALNIQRGRDHGLPHYNAYRSLMGLEPANCFAEVTSNVALQEALTAVYPNINDVDVWVGLLAEDNTPNSEVGPTLNLLLKEQFERLRDGDFYFYKNENENFANIIDKTRLSDIVKRNTFLENVADNLFRVGIVNTNIVGENNGINYQLPRGCSNCGSNELDIELEFVLDDYARETSWAIFNNAGKPVASNKYDGRDSNTNITERTCIPKEDCYKLIVFDSYGDGICCDFGNGSYSVKINNDIYYKSAGGFGFSEEIILTTAENCEIDQEVCLAPTNLFAYNLFPRSVRIGWDVFEDANNYSIYLLTDSSYNKIGSINPGMNLLLSELEPDTEYCFAIKSNCNASRSLRSEDICVKTPESRDPRIEVEAVAFKIYPNPITNQGTITYELSENQKIFIFITDVLGKVVHQISEGELKKVGHHKMEFDTQNLAEGMYYCTIKTNNTLETKKIIIAK